MSFINHEFISVERTPLNCVMQLSCIVCKTQVHHGRRDCFPKSQDPALLAVLGMNLVRYNLPDAASIFEACLRCQVLKEK